MEVADSNGAQLMQRWIRDEFAYISLKREYGVSNLEEERRIRRGLQLPEFNGRNCNNWIQEMEEIFHFFQLNESEKMKAVIMSLVGEASWWFEEEQQRRRFYEWSEVKILMWLRFGSSPTLWQVQQNPAGFGNKVEQQEDLEITNSVTNFCSVTGGCLIGGRTCSLDSGEIMEKSGSEECDKAGGLGRSGGFEHQRWWKPQIVLEREKEAVQQESVKNLNGGGHSGLLDLYLSHNDATGSRSGGGPSISVRNRRFEAKIGDLEDGFHRGEEYGGGGYVGSWLQFERGGAGCSGSGGGPGFFVGGFGEASGESGDHQKCFTSGFGGEIDNGGSGDRTEYYGGGLPRLTSQGGGSMKAGPEASGLGVADSGGKRKKIGFGGRVTVEVGAGGSRTAGGGRDGKGKVVTCGSGGADVDLKGDGGPEELVLVEGSNKGEGGKNNLEGGSHKGGSTEVSVGLQGKLTLDDSSKGKPVNYLKDESAEKVKEKEYEMGPAQIQPKSANPYSSRPGLSNCRPNSPSKDLYSTKPLNQPKPKPLNPTNPFNHNLNPHFTNNTPAVLSPFKPNVKRPNSDIIKPILPFQPNFLLNFLNSQTYHLKPNHTHPFKHDPPDFQNPPKINGLRPQMALENTRPNYPKHPNSTLPIFSPNSFTLQLDTPNFQPTILSHPTPNSHTQFPQQWKPRISFGDITFHYYPP